MRLSELAPDLEGKYIIIGDDGELPSGESKVVVLVYDSRDDRTQDRRSQKWLRVIDDRPKASMVYGYFNQTSEGRRIKW